MSAEETKHGVPLPHGLQSKGIPVALQGTSLAAILYIGTMLHSNFSKMQDQLTDAQTRAVVLEQQLVRVQERFEELSRDVQNSDGLDEQLVRLDAKLGMAMQSFDARLAALERRKGR